MLRAAESAADQVRHSSLDVNLAEPARGTPDCSLLLAMVRGAGFALLRMLPSAGDPQRILPRMRRVQYIPRPNATLLLVVQGR